MYQRGIVEWLGVKDGSTLSTKYVIWLLLILSWIL